MKMIVCCSLLICFVILVPFFLHSLAPKSLLCQSFNEEAVEKCLRFERDGKRCLKEINSFLEKNKSKLIETFQKAIVPSLRTKDRSVSLSAKNMGIYGKDAKGVDLFQNLPCVVTQTPSSYKSYAKFWEMVWEKKIEVIATVSCSSDSKKYQYWPSGWGKTDPVAEAYGSFEVKQVAEEKIGDHIVIRTIKVRKHCGACPADLLCQPITVKQYQYLFDGNIYSNTKALMDYMYRLSRALKKSVDGKLPVIQSVDGHKNKNIGSFITILKLWNFIWSHKEQFSYNVVEVINASIVSLLNKDFWAKSKNSKTMFHIYSNIFAIAKILLYEWYMHTRNDLQKDSESQVKLYIKTEIKDVNIDSEETNDEKEKIDALFKKMHLQFVEKVAQLLGGNSNPDSSLESIVDGIQKDWEKSQVLLRDATISAGKESIRLKKAFLLQNLDDLIQYKNNVFIYIDTFIIKLNDIQNQHFKQFETVFRSYYETDADKCLTLLQEMRIKIDAILQTFLHKVYSVEKEMWLHILNNMETMDLAEAMQHYLENKVGAMFVPGSVKGFSRKKHQKLVHDEVTMYQNFCSNIAEVLMEVIEPGKMIDCLRQCLHNLELLYDRLVNFSQRVYFNESNWHGFSQKVFILEGRALEFLRQKYLKGEVTDKKRVVNILETCGRLWDIEKNLMLWCDQLYVDAIEPQCRDRLLQFLSKKEGWLSRLVVPSFQQTDTAFIAEMFLSFGTVMLTFYYSMLERSLREKLFDKFGESKNFTKTLEVATLIVFREVILDNEVIRDLGLGDDTNVDLFLEGLRMSCNFGDGKGDLWIKLLDDDLSEQRKEFLADIGEEKDILKQVTMSYFPEAFKKMFSVESMQILEEST